MNRTGTYVAFDGQRTTDASKSDIHYFNLLKAWNESNEIDFNFIDSHDKTYQVNDESSKQTLYKRLEERLSASKNFLLIITEDTNYDREILNWEIEKAVDYYELPIIAVYPDYSKILNPSALKDMWPKALKERTSNHKVRCIHISFKKEPILDAINQFSVVDQNYPKGSLSYYTEETYKGWNL